MNKDLQLSIRINGNQASTDLRRFTDSASRDFRRFTQASERGVGALRREVKQLWTDFNGFSTATKLFAAAGGLESIRRTLNTNLNFERDLLEMKQNAGMTIQQVAELRKIALDAARDTLQMPNDILQGEKAYARAGMKFDQIRDSIAEASRSATVMRSTVEQIANMDFDLQSKFGIAAGDMKSAHNMAYYHGNEGRFETAAMSQQAPVYINALKQIGVKGMAGWNFTGALTQSIMKSAPATEPTQVATLIEQGLGHIAAYAKDLGKIGINVKKYGPGGQFGVEGILKLAEAMKAKGLNDIFKLDKAGIRDQEAKKFWLQLMADSGEIRKQMGIADQAAKNDHIGADLAEIKSASFGKIMAAEIQVQKIALSEGAASGTSAIGNMAGYLGDNAGEVLKGGASLAGLALLARFNRNRKNRLAGEASAKAEEIANAARNVATQNVFVTNWPASMMSPGEKIRSKTGSTGNGSSAPGTVVDEPAKGGKWAKTGKVLGAAGAAWSGWELGQSIGGVAKELIDSTVQAMTNNESATLGTALYEWINKSKIDTGGTLEVKLPPGFVVSRVQSNDQRQQINVDSGPIMVGAR